jgi:hypothetical protein
MWLAKNLLEAFVSWMIATKKNGWTYERAGAGSSDKIEFRPLDWQRFVSHTLENRRRARQCLQSVPTHFMLYEDIVADYAATFVAAQHFLGLTAEYLLPPTKRQENRPLPERFTNWDFVKKALNGTDWEGCLYGDPPNWTTVYS